MPAPNLSSPYPPSYRPPKLKGVPKIVQAMAQPPVGWGVGFGQSEQSKVSQQQANYHLATEPGKRCHACRFMDQHAPTCQRVDGYIQPQYVCDLFQSHGFGIGQSEGDFMPHDPRPLIGWQPSPLAQAGQVFSNFGSAIHNLPGPLGQLTGAAGDLANLAMPQSGQAGIGGVPSALKDSAMTPLNMLGRLGSDVQPNNVANAITTNLPGANKPVPQTNVPVLTGAADLANQLTAPGLGLSPEVGELATQAARLPGRAGDIAANVALGVKGIPRIAGGSVPKGKIRVPSVDEINQYVAAHPGNVSDLLTQFRDALPDMQPEQVQEALGIFRQHDPTIFKKQGVKGLVTEAAATVNGQPSDLFRVVRAYGGESLGQPGRQTYLSRGVPIDTRPGWQVLKVDRSQLDPSLLSQAGGHMVYRGVIPSGAIEHVGVVPQGGLSQGAAGLFARDNTVSQNIADAADLVDAKREQEANAARTSAGKPAEQSVAVPHIVGDVAAEDEPVIAALPDAPSDIQDAVVSVIADKMRGPRTQLAGRVIGGATGAFGGWNLPGYTGKTQDERDNVKYKLFSALAGGLVGVGVGGALVSGPARSSLDRVMSQVMRGWLTPSSAGLKGVTDIPNLLFAPAIHGAERTANFGPKVGAQQALEYLRGYRMGVKPAWNAMVDAVTGQRDLSTVFGREQASSSFLDSPIAHIIGGINDFATTLQEAAIKAADAPLRAAEKERLDRTVTGNTFMPWFQRQLESNADFAATIASVHPDEWEAIASGLWSDQSVQDVAKGYYINDAVDKYQLETLGHGESVKQRAQRLTLTSDIAPLFTGAQTFLSDEGKVLARVPAKFNRSGQSGLMGRAMYGMGSTIADSHILNPPVPFSHEVIGMDGKTYRPRIPFGRLLGGFYKITANAADDRLNWTPFLGELNQFSFGPFSGYKDIPVGRRIAKQALGAMIGTALVHVIGDNATGSGPTWDKNAYSAWRDTHVPNSVQIDGHWIPDKYLGPIGAAAIHAAGALNDYHDYELLYKQQYGSSPTPEAMARFATGEFLGFLGDASYFTEVQDLFNMVLGVGQSAMSGQSIPSSVISQAGFQIGGLVPEPLALAATAERPTKPSTSGSLTADALSRIPGAEQNVPPQRDAIGQPVPNPQQGAKALLGAYAGQQPMQDTTADQWLAPIGKEQAPGLGTLNARVFHGTYDNQGNLVPGSGLPMPPDIRGAVQQRTGQILQQNTDALFNSDAYQKLSDANKAKAARAYQTAAHDQAFFDTVNNYGRDKYIASLNPQQQSQFRDLELTQQLAQAGAKNRYALANGQPYDPSKWAAMDKAIQLWQGKPSPPAAVTQYKRLQAYGKANNLMQAVGSEDWGDYARKHYLSGLSDADWQAFQHGQLALFGKPGQYTPQQQLAFYGAQKVYSALPTGDSRKNKMHAQIVALQKQSNVNLLKRAESPTAAVQAAEAAYSK